MGVMNQKENFMTVNRSSSATYTPPLVSREDLVSRQDYVTLPPEEHQDTVHNDSRARTREGLEQSGKLQQSQLQAKLDVLGKHSVGPEVLELQKNLNAWRIANGKPPIAEDKVFGDETEAAVKDFQKSTGLKPDGLAGPQVKARLELEKDLDFKKLDPSVQQKICNQWINNKNAPVARENLRNVFKDPHFQNISPESQKLALDRLAEDPKQPAHASNIRFTMNHVDSMEHDAAFQKLPSDTQTDLRKAMFRLSNSPGTEGLLELSKDGRFANLDRDQQAKVIDTIVSKGKLPKGEVVPDFMKNVLNSQTLKHNDNAGLTNEVLRAADEAAPDENKMRQLTNLLNDTKFANASYDEQLAMLNALRLKSRLEKK
jgi:hypothetical protein